MSSRRRRWRTRLAGIVGALCVSGAGAEAQPPRPPAPSAATRVTIPYLANDTTPEALDFAAAECDVAADGEGMDCRFRQVFVTTASIDASACVISSNGYDLSLRREAQARWVSRAAPAGDCGLVEVTTLQDGGTTRWTMTVQREATRNVERADCRAASARTDSYSWRNIRRTLPCTTIQPGAIER